MISRRGFTICAFCAGGGLIADAVGARAQAPGFTRTILNRMDFPGDKMATIQVLVELEPNALIARHTHPGIETGYMIEGGGVLSVKGTSDLPVAAGTGYQVPSEVPHALRNGDKKSRIFAVYVVDKDKPLASPAPE